MRTRQSKCAVVVLAGLAGTSSVLGLGMSAQGIDAESVTAPSQKLIASLGDLDNDKDLDLVVLNVEEETATPYFDGDKSGKSEHVIENLTNAVDMVLLDVTSPLGGGPDGYIDILFLITTNRGSTIRLYVNQQQENQTKSGKWFDEYTPPSGQGITYPFELNGDGYTSLWGGPFVSGDGGDLFVYSENGFVNGDETQPEIADTYTAAKNKSVLAGIWQGFQSDDARTLTTNTESLKSVANQEAAGTKFIIFNSSGNVVSLRDYTFGVGIH